MKKPIIFMFSGQGSHYYQMGRELFERNPIFKQWMQSGEVIYKEITGLSILDELYKEQHTKSLVWNRTLQTHPAIFLMEHALGQVLLAQNIIPDYVMGASLGEFTAAVFAGMMTFENALLAIITQAQVIEEKCVPGRMLAILRPSTFYENNTFLQENSVLAATNFPAHFIVSSQVDAIKKIELLLAEQSINFQALAVSHAFHSHFIDTAKPAYTTFIHQQFFKLANLPFISCVYADKLNNVSPTHFWDVIRLPIQFQTTIQALEEKNNYTYLDVGPSGTLATFVKYTLDSQSSSTTFAAMTPFGQDSATLTKLSEFLI